MKGRFSVIDRTQEEYLPGGTILVSCVLDQEVIGTIEINGQKDRDEEYWLLNQLFVAKGHRKKGIATALIEESINVCRQLNAEEPTPLAVLGIVHIENHGSIAAFEANGFTHDEQRDPDEMVLLTYRLELPR